MRDEKDRLEKAKEQHRALERELARQKSRRRQERDINHIIGAAIGPLRKMKSIVALKFSDSHPYTL